MASSGTTLKPGAQGGGFHVRFSSGPVTEVHGVFNNRELSSSCAWCCFLLFYVCFSDDLWFLQVGVESIVDPDGQIFI